MPAPCLSPLRRSSLRAVPTLCAFLLLAPGTSLASFGRSQEPLGGLSFARDELKKDPSARPLVLVLPLASRKAGGPEWFPAGAARFLEEALTLGGYQVVDATARRALLHRAGLAAAPRLSLASACHLARDAGARYVVTGTWQGKGQAIELSVRAVDVAHMNLLAELTSKGVATEPGQLLGPLATGLMPEGRLAGRLDALAERPSPALTAWLEAAGEPEQAEQHLRAAVDLAPDFVPARLALGEVLLDAGHLKEAQRVIDGTAVDVEHRFFALLLTGRLSLAREQTSKAVELFQEAVHLRPNVAALSWLAEAQLATGDRKSAAATAQRVLSTTSDEAEALALLRRTEPTPGT